MRLAAAIILIAAACETEPSPSRADDGSARSEPLIVVTKSEITYEGKSVGGSESVAVGGHVIATRDLAALPDAATTQPIRCELVVEKLKKTVAAVDPAIAVIAGTKTPVILSSCIYEGWPEALKQCIVTASTEQLAAHHCDALVPDELAQKLLDRLAPGQHISPRDFLQR